MHHQWSLTSLMKFLAGVYICLVIITLLALHINAAWQRDKKSISTHPPTHFNKYLKLIALTSYDDFRSDTLPYDGFNSESPPYNITSVNMTTNVPYRYVIESVNWEQLTMATNNFVTLTWLAQNWSAQGVEPFTKNSRFYGLPLDHSMKPILNVLYDSKEFNKLLAEFHIGAIASYNDFIKYAKREIILVYILFEGMRPGRTEAEVEEYTTLQRTNKIVNCTGIKYIQTNSDMFTRMINSKIPANFSKFTVTHCCCINNSDSGFMDRGKLMEGCSIPPTGNITVVFYHWKGITNDRSKHFRLYLPEAHFKVAPHPLVNTYPFTDSIISNATAFIESITDKKNFIGLHIRAEKMLYDKGIQHYHNLASRNYFLERCFNLTESLLSRSNLSMIFTFTDMGKYGSRSLRWNSSDRDILYTMLSQRGIKVHHYDPFKFNGMDDSGFVAAVEQEVLSRSKKLITIGGGSFQRQLAVRFHNYNKDKRKFKAYAVCHSRKKINVGTIR